MTKQEALDFIAKNSPTYLNQLVYFESADITARVTAMEAVDDGDHFVATCYLENPKEEDPDFENHIFSHISLEDLIATGRVL